MGLKDAKIDNVAGWAVASLVGGVAIDSRTPLPLRVDVVLCAVVFGDLALLWFLRDDVGKWWRPHRRLLGWGWTFLRVVFTRETWRDVRATSSAVKARRSVKGTAAELLHMRNDRAGKREALALVQQWVRGAAPVGTGDAWIAGALPRRVLSIHEVPTGVVVTVASAKNAGGAKKLRDWAGGIESNAKVAKGSLHISHPDGQSEHITAWRFTLRPEPKAGRVTLQPGRSVADGVWLGVDAITAEPVYAPVLGFNALTAGITNAGKSNVVSVETEQIAACDDGDVWVIDHTEGMPWLRDIATRYYDSLAGAITAIGDILAEYDRRNAYRRAEGLPEIPPSPEWPHIRVVFDEVINLFVAVRETSDRNKLIERWAEFMRLCRKEGMTVHLAPQRITDDVLPRELSTQCAVRIGLTLPTPESRLLLQHAHVDGFMDCSKLKPKSGQAIVMLPGDTEARRVNIAERPDPKSRPKAVGPTVGPSVGPVSEGLSEALSTAESASTEGGEGDDPTASREERILVALRSASEPMTMASIAARIGAARSTIIPIVGQFVAEGRVIEGGTERRRTYALTDTSAEVA